MTSPKGHWAACRVCTWRERFDTRSDAVDAFNAHSREHAERSSQDRTYKPTEFDRIFLKRMRICHDE